MALRVGMVAHDALEGRAHRRAIVGVGVPLHDRGQEIVPEGARADLVVEGLEHLQGVSLVRANETVERAPGRPGVGETEDHPSKTRDRIGALVVVTKTQPRRVEGRPRRAP